ncbi:ATP12 family chaperone protein [Croceicoccus sp. Ery5]|uniref:ATP12 family chaperone protein n=1 Tax=Croceicoccus sp. Ery5 TaxID=1703340 RepID=UPI001E37EAC6|nr:ATP12 family protein [Croceicoccus sp. Ery5]
MKRFYREVTVQPQVNGWQVALDGRGMKTQGGAPQIVPTRAMADALAAEWAAQGDEIDPKSLPLRDMADYAIDRVTPDPASAIAAIMPFAETDTLCYRADDGDALRERQEEAWEPLVAAAEKRLGIEFSRVAGISYTPHPPATRARLVEELEEMDPFTLAAVQNLSSLAASLIAALESLRNGQDAETLFATANLEEDWQAQQWGWEHEALARRDARARGFALACQFALLARG